MPTAHDSAYSSQTNHKAQRTSSNTSHTTSNLKHRKSLSSKTSSGSKHRAQKATPNSIDPNKKHSNNSTTQQKSGGTAAASTNGTRESAEALGRLLQNALAAHTRNNNTKNNDSDQNITSNNDTRNNSSTGDHHSDTTGQGTMQSGRSTVGSTSAQVSRTTSATTARKRRDSGNHGNARKHDGKAQLQPQPHTTQADNRGSTEDPQELTHTTHSHVSRRNSHALENNTLHTPSAQAQAQAHAQAQGPPVDIRRDGSTGADTGNGADLHTNTEGYATGYGGGYGYPGGVAQPHDTALYPQHPQGPYHPHDQRNYAQPHHYTHPPHGTPGTAMPGGGMNDQQLYINGQLPAQAHLHTTPGAHLGGPEGHGLPQSGGTAYQPHVTTGGNRSRKNSERDSDGNVEGKKIKRIRRPPSEIERAYVCDVVECDKGYGSQGALDLHRKTKHDIAKKGKDLPPQAPSELWSG